MAVSKEKTSKKKATTKKSQLKRQGSVMPTGHTKHQQTTDYTQAEISLFEEHDRDKYMSIGDHLEELRRRLLWVIAIVLIASAVAGYFIEDIHSFMIEPYSEVAKRVSIERGSPGADKLILGSVYGPFQIYFQLALTIGGIFTLPIALSLLWGFVTPAVSKKAATVGHISVAASTVLFWGGVVFAWLYLFPFSLNMMLDTFLPSGVMAQTSLEKYYSFLFMIVIGAGLTFQLPMVVVILGALGIAPVAFHARIWKGVVVGVFVFAAFVTPPDPFSMFALACPLLVLYTIAVGIVWFIERTRRKDSLNLKPAITT